MENDKRNRNGKLGFETKADNIDARRRAAVGLGHVVLIVAADAGFLSGGPAAGGRRQAAGSGQQPVGTVCARQLHLSSAGGAWAKFRCSLSPLAAKCHRQTRAGRRARSQPEVAPALSATYAGRVSARRPARARSASGARRVGGAR